MVLETKEGEISIEHRGKQLTAVQYHQMQARAEEVSRKELMAKLAEKATNKGKYRPSRRHPWKKVKREFSKPKIAEATVGG